jgi:hypothetical protein
MTIQHHPQEHRAETRPLTYDDAGSVYRGTLLTAGRDRYHELSDRDMAFELRKSSASSGSSTPRTWGTSW